MAEKKEVKKQPEKKSKAAIREMAAVKIKEALDVIEVFEKVSEEVSVHLIDTPDRIASAWIEFTDNIDSDPSPPTTFPSDIDELVIAKDISFNSMCAHHFFPFSGIAHVAYLPNGKLIGLSKIPRIVRHYAKRPQIQEILCSEVVEFIHSTLEPTFTMVVMKATHQCCKCRGIESDNSLITSAIRYNFPDDEPDVVGSVDSLKKETFDLIKIL
jgi:GTP cyclohydrolase I